MKPRRHGNRKISQRADEVEIYGVIGIPDMPRGIDSGYLEFVMETNRRKSIDQQEEVEDGQEDLEDVFMYEEDRENATTKEGQLFRQE